MPKQTLRGMTWSHARGYDPMVATARQYAATHPDVEIIWEKRSLQAFADRPIEEMAADYDLMVIDHPHVGQVASSGELLALNGRGRAAELATLAAQSIGGSHGSYEINGQQWALAIDAATPVAAYRPDLLTRAPSRWSEVLELAQNGQVAFALIPINALMVFMGMAKNLQFPVAKAQFISPENGTKVLGMLQEITRLMPAKCLELDPIGIFDWMGNTADGPAYSPFGYGYTNYSRDGYCAFPLSFADAPGMQGGNPQGTVLGGTGIAVSASSKHKDSAVDYAFWIAGADCQAGLFFDTGGQPANAVAWESDHCNAASRDFFRNTRATLDSAWIRPRYNGYMWFQDQAGNILHACLRGETSAFSALSRLESAYQESQE